jgi:hypothetical protein
MRLGGNIHDFKNIHLLQLFVVIGPVLTTDCKIVSSSTLSTNLRLTLSDTALTCTTNRQHFPTSASEAPQYEHSRHTTPEHPVCRTQVTHACPESACVVRTTALDDTRANKVSRSALLAPHLRPNLPPLKRPADLFVSITHCAMSEV